MCPVDLCRVAGHVRSGRVLIGDCYLNVRPTRGMGASNVLSEIDVLGRYVPEWR